MLLRTCIVLLLLLSACATTAPSPKEPVALYPRVANLQRAAALPWADGGRCVVQEASNEWAVLVEKCFRALDHERIRFHDPTGRCAVASAGAAAMGLGVCILVAPEIVIGAVIITGAVVVAVAIKEELEAYERRSSRERAGPEPQLDLGTRTLWEVKTDNFDKHSPRSQEFFVRVKFPEIKREQTLAEACGYKFVVGVRSPAHKAALLALDPDIAVVVMDWC